MKKVSGGVLPAGWEKQVDFMIAEFHSQDAYELKELSHVDKDAEGMITIVRRTYGKEGTNKLSEEDLDLICNCIREHY
ncbi:MAG: hypothetical protein II459_02245 [Erysipelotrichaceae bacterium]|nr:hypothetical protein [Erysipelotrichaceae bacterium]MBQ2232019.1 hypothetical protein [Erysipelotrichaceae bacterium]